MTTEEFDSFQFIKNITVWHLGEEHKIMGIDFAKRLVLLDGKWIGHELIEIKQ